MSLDINIEDTTKNIKEKAGAMTRRLRMNRGMSIEDRRNLTYILDMNTRLHKLQPYFDLISAYYWDMMHIEKSKQSTGIRTGVTRSPKGTKANTSRRGSVMTNTNMNTTNGSNMAASI